MGFSVRPSRRACAAAGVGAAVALLALPAIHASAATVPVPCSGNNSTDVTALKTAITAANVAGGQTLSLGAGCTFTLSTVDNGANGLPLITSDVTIIGNGDTITRSSAGGTPTFRLFEVSDTGNLTLAGVVLTNGDATGTEGGAIAALGTGIITVDDGSTLSGNTAPGGDGGAIFTKGALIVSNSSILNNTVTNAHDGGGIAAEGSGTQILINGSTFVGNDTAGGYGGAVYTDQPLSLVNSTLNGNSSGIGGGLSDNSSGGPVTVFDSTISANTASVHGGGGGIANLDLPANLVVSNTILSGNTPDNCGTSIGLDLIHDGGHNLENGTSCHFSSNAVNADPILGALASNGGPTQTRAITSSSPAFQAGDPAVCTAAVPNGAGGFDQRGVARKAACDIGAFEAAAVVAPTPSPSGLPVPAAGAASDGVAGPGSGLLIALAGLALIGALSMYGRVRRGSIA